MSNDISRRTALGLGAFAAAAASVAVAAPAQAAPVNGTGRISRTYEREKAAAGGNWRSHIATVDSETGVWTPVVQDNADVIVKPYSVQKLAVAMCVLDKVDRGELALTDQTILDKDIILGGSGIYHLHTKYGDSITIANFLTALLLVSDNTAVRLCGRFVPAAEINQILAAKGFVHTRVEPVANPNRFFMGNTTPREVHSLLSRLATKTLLSPESCDFMLGILRWINGYHDGVRRNMSSNQRSRVATKYGADFNTLGASRHEAGIIFGADGSPVLTYAMFAEALGDLDNYGATHPAVEAHAKLGKVMFDVVDKATAPAATARHSVPSFQQPHEA